MSLMSEGKELTALERDKIEQRVSNYYKDIRIFGLSLLLVSLLLSGTCGGHILYGDWETTFSKTPVLHLCYAFTVVIAIFLLTGIGVFEYVQKDLAVSAIQRCKFKYVKGKAVDVLTTVEGGYTIDNEHCVLLPEYSATVIEKETVVVVFRVNGTNFVMTIDE